MNKTDHHATGTPTWKQTRIWSELANKRTPEADSVRATLEICMPDIERVLAGGGTAPLDFTLHDVGHSFRVAERMAEITPTDVFPGLSTYELALLLLSAYLHDIGMTPEQRKVQTLYTSFLLMILRTWMNRREGNLRNGSMRIGQEYRLRSPIRPTLAAIGLPTKLSPITAATATLTGENSGFMGISLVWD